LSDSAVATNPNRHQRTAAKTASDKVVRVELRFMRFLRKYLAR
jgi:hypothetical protein